MIVARPAQNSQKRCGRLPVGTPGASDGCRRVLPRSRSSEHREPLADRNQPLRTGVLRARRGFGLPREDPKLRRERPEEHGQEKKAVRPREDDERWHTATVYTLRLFEPVPCSRSGTTQRAIVTTGHLTMYLYERPMSRIAWKSRSPFRIALAFVRDSDFSLMWIRFRIADDSPV
jgi:hypothetical protein